MIDPPWPRSTRYWPKTWQPRKTLLTLIPMIRSYSSSVILKNGVGRIGPRSVDDNIDPARTGEHRLQQALQLRLVGRLRGLEVAAASRRPDPLQPRRRLGLVATDDATSAPAPAMPSAIAPQSSPVPPTTTATLPFRENRVCR